MKNTSLEKQDIIKNYQSRLQYIYSMYKEVKPSVKNTYKIDKVKIK